MLGSFEIIEEVINSVFGKLVIHLFIRLFSIAAFSVVFIIRYAERRIDQLLDSAILSYTPMASEFEAVQFESEWSFLRPFSGKKKPPPSPGRGTAPASPPSPSPNRPISPTASQSTISTSASRGLSSLRQSVNRARGHSSATPISSIFQDSASQAQPSSLDLTSFLTSLHTLLMLSDINPVIITQLWSQVMYWTSCKRFFSRCEGHF